MLRVSSFDESSVYFMSIFCSSKSNLIYTLLCPLCLPIKSIILDSWVVSPSMLTSNLYTYLQQFIQRINQSFYQNALTLVLTIPLFYQMQSRHKKIHQRIITLIVFTKNMFQAPIDSYMSGLVEVIKKGYVN